MGKRTNLFEINETLAIRKCTKKVFSGTISVYCYFQCLGVYGWGWGISQPWSYMGFESQRNSSKKILVILWVWHFLPGWYSQTAKSGVNEKLWYQLPACWSFPPSVAQPGRQQAPHLRLQAVAPSSWFQSPPGWRQLLADLANLPSFHFIALPIVNYPPILNWGRDTEQHLHISPPPPHPTSCFLPRKFSDKFNLSCDRSAACWRWMFDSVISHFLFGRNQNFLPAIGLGAAIPALLALLLHHHPDHHHPSTSTSTSAIPALLALLLHHHPDHLDHRHHPQLPTLSYHHHPHPCYSASAIPTLLTSIIQLRLPQCLSSSPLSQQVWKQDWNPAPFRFSLLRNVSNHPQKTCGTSWPPTLTKVGKMILARIRSKYNFPNHMLPATLS